MVIRRPQLFASVLSHSDSRWVIPTIHLNDHLIYNGSDVIFSKKFLLKPLHYHLLPGLTPGFGVTFFFGLKYASFIGDVFVIIPAERGHPSSYLFNIIHHLFEGNHAASLPSVFLLLSLYLPNLRLCAIF